MLPVARLLDLLCQGTIHLVSKPNPQNRSSRKVILPQVILIDGSDSPHFGDLSTNTNKLETNMCARFNSQAFVIRELRWCGIGIVHTGLWDGLKGYCQSMTDARI